jgi:hypothetical protein
VRPKVFGIGFHKTGTTSLAAALQHLGYDVCRGARPLRDALGHRRLMEHLRHQRVEPIVDVAERFDACVDNPWFMLFRQLDERFPGSRFILTVREESQWLASALRYYGESESELRQWVYGAAAGSPIGNEETYRYHYRLHNENVRAYFKGRSGQLLIVDWTTDGWDPLTRYLGHEPPDVAFPHISPVRG